MGKSYQPVPFIDNNFAIDAYEASSVELLGKISLEQFADGEEVRVSRCLENGEYLFEKGRYGCGMCFAEGLQVVGGVS